MQHPECDDRWYFCKNLVVKYHSLNRISIWQHPGIAWKQLETIAILQSIGANHGLPTDLEKDSFDVDGDFFKSRKKVVKHFPDRTQLYSH